MHDGALQLFVGVSTLQVALDSSIVGRVLELLRVGLVLLMRLQRQLEVSQSAGIGARLDRRSLLRPQFYVCLVDVENTPGVGEQVLGVFRRSDDFARADVVWPTARRSFTIDGPQCAVR